MVDNIFVLIISVIVIFLGLVTFLGDTKNSFRKHFFLLCVSMSLWQLFVILSDISNDYSLLSNRLAFLGPVLIVFFLWQITRDLWLLAELNNTKSLKLTNLTVYLGTIALFILSLSSLVVVQISLRTNIDNPGYDIVRGAGYYVYMIVLISLFVLCILKLFYIFTSTNITNVKKQSIMIILAMVFTGLITVVTSLIVPLVSGTSSYAYLSSVSLLVFTVTIFFAIVKYQAIETKIIVVRAVAYVLSLLFLASLLFLLIYFIISRLNISYNLSIAAQFIYLFITLSLAVTYPYIKRFFDKWTNNFFFQNNYNPQSLINEINSIIVSSNDISKTLYSVSQTILRDMKFDKIEIYINKNSDLNIEYINNIQNRWEHSLNTDIFINNISTISEKVVNDKEYEELYKKPDINKLGLVNIVKVISNNNDIGMIGVGEKQSGTAINQKDIQILNIIADEIAITIESYLRLKEIERFNETLQQNVKEATAELQKSNEKLKSLDEAKDEFISMASHQLRTPLTSVKGYISMLLEGDAGPINNQQKTFLSQAFTSSQRMVYLISDLLNVSRLKTGKFVIEPTEVDLPQVVQLEVEQLQTTAAARGLTLKVDYPKDFPKLMLDETKIHQVIMNFIDNAIYYTPSGGSIKVVLNVTKKTAELKVIDTGIGVPKKSQHELFTKFFRADNAQKARPDGTGLGLFMAKKVIIAQGGSIIFNSTENKGSTFGFSFALSKVLPPNSDSKQ